MKKLASHKSLKKLGPHKLAALCIKRVNPSERRYIWPDYVTRCVQNSAGMREACEKPANKQSLKDYRWCQKARMAARNQIAKNRHFVNWQYVKR